MWRSKAFKFKSRLAGIGLVLCALLSCQTFTEASDANSRPASLAEIQKLFDLVTVGPQRQRFVAVITSSETKWSDEQIAAEIKQQNETFPDMMRLSEARQRERTNAVAQSHSGIRILHVQEWYSGNLYRIDQTDEGMVSQQYLKDHPGTYKISFVDIDDPVLSPYRSFVVDHQLHDVQLSKTTLYAKNDLWRGLGLDKEVVLPLMLTLQDRKSVPNGRPSTDADLGTLKLDSARAELLHNGSNPIWHLDVITEGGQENRMRFTLRGKTMSLIEPYKESDQEFVYVVGRAGERSVCMETSVTNHTTHVFFISKREDFDSQGFPRAWKRTTIIPGLPTKQIDVAFKEVDLNAVFDDKRVFLPEFATNDIVSDVTSGKAEILQNPAHSKIGPSLTRQNSFERVVIFCLFGLTTLLLGIGLLRFKGHKAH
jgi:hypothetical protein